MIKIKAKDTGEGSVDVKIKLDGPSEDIIHEAVGIMENLPKALQDTNMQTFLGFIAEISKSEMFGVQLGLKKEGNGHEI